MSTELWTLVGVAIGGLLGGGGQLLVDHLRGNRERDQRLSEVRRAAYVEMLAAEMSAFDLVSVATTTASLKGSDERRLESVLDARVAFSRLNSAVGQVGLGSPEDTFNAAADLMHAAIDDGRSTHDTRGGSRLGASRARFLELAKRDLGLDT